MTEDALPVAIEAREQARSAHKRLDGINGQVGKLGDKMDVIGGKVDSILITVARDEGAKTVNRGLIDSRRFLITTIVLILTSSVVSLLLTLALRSH